MNFRTTADLEAALQGHRYQEALAILSDIGAHVRAELNRDPNLWWNVLCRWRPWFGSPRQRILRAIGRLSRERVIWVDEYNSLVLRMAKKWSGNASQTYGSLARTGSLVRSSWRIQGGRESWWYDKLRPNDELIAEARQNGWQFCLLDKHRHTKLMRLYNEESKILATRTAINKLKKEIRHGNHDQEHRAT